MKKNWFKNLFKYIADKLCLNFLKPKKQSFKLLKILPPNSTTAGASLPQMHSSGLAIIIDSTSEDDARAYFQSSSYKKIFGKEKQRSNASDQRLSIVKISYQGKSIHRKYRAIALTGFKAEHIALTPQSIYQLLPFNMKLNSILNEEVTVSRGNWFCYYWNHPIDATRISMRIGIISIILSVIGVLLSLKCEIKCLFELICL